MNYSFPPVVAIPSIKRRWKTIKINNIGQIASNDPAINCGKFVENCPCNEANPADNVILSIDILTINGHIKSLNANNAVKIPNATNPEFASGNIILKNVPQCYIHQVLRLPLILLEFP